MQSRIAVVCRIIITTIHVPNICFANVLLNAFGHVELGIRTGAHTTAVAHNVQQRETKCYGESQPTINHNGQ
jgi:hypothetical protein